MNLAGEFFVCQKNLFQVVMEVQEIIFSQILRLHLLWPQNFEGPTTHTHTQHTHTHTTHLYCSNKSQVDINFLPIQTSENVYFFYIYRDFSIVEGDLLYDFVMWAVCCMECHSRVAVSHRKDEDHCWRDSEIRAAEVHSSSILAWQN